MASVSGKAGVDQLFARLPDQIEKMLRSAGKAGAKVVLEEAKDRVHSEAVREGLRMRSTVSTGVITVKITVAPGWARSLGTWLEYGTSPHFISVDPRDRGGRSVGRINKLLKDGSREEQSLVIGGRFVGASVHHPGARAEPFLRVSLDLKRTEAFAAAQSYIDAHVKPSGITASDDDGQDEA